MMSGCIDVTPNWYLEFGASGGEDLDMGDVVPPEQITTKYGNITLDEFKKLKPEMFCFTI